MTLHFCVVFHIFPEIIFLGVYECLFNLAAIFFYMRALFLFSHIINTNLDSLFL